VTVPCVGKRLKPLRGDFDNDLRHETSSFRGLTKCRPP
jgi:hypothetical protein